MHLRTFLLVILSSLKKVVNSFLCSGLIFSLDQIPLSLKDLLCYFWTLLRDPLDLLLRKVGGGYNPTDKCVRFQMS